MGKGIGSLVFDSASIQCVEEEKQGAIYCFVVLVNHCFRVG